VAGSRFAIQPEHEPDSATVASLHCNVMMRYARFTINVVYCNVITDLSIIN